MKWFLEERGYRSDDVTKNGNRFLIGNGYIGYRGTPDEFSDKECVALNVAGLYDGVRGKWRETVNLFNPFYLIAYCGNVALDVRGENVLSHSCRLDIRSGVFSRTTAFSVNGTRVELYSERFCSMARENVLCSRTTLKADRDITLTLRFGVDDKIWDINGPHIKDVTSDIDGNVITVKGITQELGLPVRTSCRYSCTFENTRGSFAETTVSLKKGESYELERVAEISCKEWGRYALKENYSSLFEENRLAWQEKWKVSDVVLQGDEYAQFALRYSLYHLLILSPRGDYSIAARGLSGQTYKGAVFWDTEMFMLPFYLATDTACAKRLVQYRVNCLEEAKKKAKSYGYEGAYYAWESQNGYDACSDFNVVDVFTHRPVRTYFKDKQIHISAAVAYGVYRYFECTGDEEILRCGGLETMLQCAWFYYTYSYYNHSKDRYELLDVMGPDEYHERVNNNAYTNYMAHFITEKALSLYERYGAATELPDGAIEKLRRWTEKLYLPVENENGVVEQFDGYYTHEDVYVEEVRKRLVVPNEYWGGSTGIATATRVIKQADTVMLLDLLPQYFTEKAVRANYDFYLPYTEHGSSLSACMYALSACRSGRPDTAWEWFIKTAEIDLIGGGKQWAGEIYIGGTHPAANGGAWMTAVYGFAGMKYENGKITFAPALPANITSLSFTVLEEGVRYAVTVTKNKVEKKAI